MDPTAFAAAAAAADEDAFDAELAAFLAPDETAAALLARTFVEPLRTGLPLIDRFTSFRGGQLLELAGPAGCGRTTALLQVAVTCILPEVANGVPYGGRGGKGLPYRCTASQCRGQAWGLKKYVRTETFHK